MARLSSYAVENLSQDQDNLHIVAIGRGAKPDLASGVHPLGVVEDSSCPTVPSRARGWRHAVNITFKSAERGKSTICTSWKMNCWGCWISTSCFHSRNIEMSFHPFLSFANQGVGAVQEGQSVKPVVNFYIDETVPHRGGLSTERGL